MKKMMAACALVAIALAGCSKTDTTSTGGGSTIAGSSSSSNKLTKAALIEQADKICVENKAAQKAITAPKSDADIADYLKKVVEQQKSAVKKVKDLGDPDTDADKLKDAIAKQEKVIDLFEKKMPEIAKDPSLVDTDKELKAAGEEADKAAKDFGFKECGKDSGSSSSGSSDETTTTKKGSGSSDETTTTKKSGSSGGAKLTPEQCVDVASANLDLVTASSKAEAEAAAEKLNAFDPPADVKKAIDTFAENGGPDYTDPKTGDYAALITEWMKSICPGLSS